MKRSLLWFVLAACSIGASAQSQTYKCRAADGKVTFQNSPCASTGQANAAPTTPAKNSPSLTELIVQCSKLPKESTEYHTCSAQLSCKEAGNEGAKFQDCVNKLTEGRRRADLATEDKAAEARSAAALKAWPKKKIEIGDDLGEVINTHGYPGKTNTTTTGSGTSKQLIYYDNHFNVKFYIYTLNDRVTAIQNIK